MALTVVLVRHGEAKRKELGQSDFDRELTTWGAEALAEAFPRAMALVDVTAASELWMSPAVRARQTAEIANKTLGIETCREFRALYDQDGDAFLAELSKTNADVVVAVGHIPFMEDVCARLCGTFLSFSTGAAAAISISDKKVRKLADGRARGHLQWFVQGPLT
ncbi:MAG: histidine phosphatase family protein [Atopobiaceae bacterium]|nr:histidine phosphatase family protein [Atopobiaceae bacterium]MBR3315007.1 histidine phosphatase family protein [Atopobiaceae bacterium]